MFEPAEVGRKVSKKNFKEREESLRTRLLVAQRAIRTRDVPVVIIVSGVEGAGKGGVVNRLSKWLDARGLATHAFWDETQDELERPDFWRFWRALPPRGSMAILFGSWYTKPIVEHVQGRMSAAEFDRAMIRIREFEHALQVDHAVIVKMWFHLSAERQLAALEDDRKRGAVSPLLKSFSRKYSQFAEVSERAIRQTDTGPNPWQVIEASDARYRDLTAGEHILACIERHLSEPEPHRSTAGSGTAGDVASEGDCARTVLDRLPGDKTIDRETYNRKLERLQSRVNKLNWAARQARTNCVCVFEGWDAAGKGGAIRRLTYAMDARLYRVISVAAPTDEERAHHYLWRFWRHIPRGGYTTIYDRSWYGRVLVERVEGFARNDEWRRAYKEINDFEEQLHEHGAAVLKFWLHIDAEEQLRRFKEREEVPWKRHKITDEDWRNRERWGAYAVAVNDMVGRTSTQHAPWHLVPANDKKWARIQVLKHYCEAMGARLDSPP